MKFFRRRHGGNAKGHNGPRRGKSIYIDDEKCTRCGNCIRTCKQNVFERIDDGKGAHIEVKNIGNCTRCRECFTACRFNALMLVRKIV